MDDVEVGCPFERKDLSLPFTDNNTDLIPVTCVMTITLYVNVSPITILTVIKKHGGMTADNDNLPPMVERDEDGCLWSSAVEPPSTIEEEEEEEVQ